MKQNPITNPDEFVVFRLRQQRAFAAKQFAVIGLDGNCPLLEKPTVKRALAGAGFQAQLHVTIEVADIAAEEPRFSKDAFDSRQHRGLEIEEGRPDANE